MAGAATASPAATANASSNTTATTTTTITTDIASATTNVTSCTVHNNNNNEVNDLIEKSRSERTLESNNNHERSDLKLIRNDPSTTSIHNDDLTDSEESADSLYYTASDHTNSDAYSETRGDGEESFEAVYESIEAPSGDICKIKLVGSNSSLKDSLTDSNHNETMSLNRSESPKRVHPLTPLSRCPTNTYEIKSNIRKFELKNKSKVSDTIDDAESTGSGSDSDHHQDSGYESPVKADVHSSDDTASTASNSSVENHYEDIDPARLGNEGRVRESSRRGRSTKDVPSSNRDSPRGNGDCDDDEEDSDDARQRQRLQELDDLIAEFGDVSSSSNDSIPGHRQLQSTQSASSPTTYLQQRSPLLRTASEPTPPPPPPMPCHTPSPRSSPAVHRSAHHHSRDSSSSKSSHSPSSSFNDGGPQSLFDPSDAALEDGVIKPSEFIRRNSQRGERGGSFRGHKKVDRPMSLPLDVAEHYGKIMANGKDKPPYTTQDDSAPATLPLKPHLTNGKSLPFIPPKFPAQPSGSGLIKPSEYLKSLGSTGGRSPSSGNDVKSLVAMHSTEPLSGSFDSHDHSSHHHNDSQPASMPPGPLPSIPEATEEEPSRNGGTGGAAPPPPPAPPAPPASSTNTLNRSNTLNSSKTNGKSVLPTISVTDLQSVQLKKTETKASKTTSLPLRMPMSPEPALTLAKNDVIAELKMGVDIPGIKKLKSERAKEEAKSGKIEKEELNRQFSAVNFVDQVPETDNAGNRIPDWKRQMLARKAAERAKKEAEEARQQQMEEKRQQSIPPWKRQLMNRQTDDVKRDPPVTPRTKSPVRIALPIKH